MYTQEDVKKVQKRLLEMAKAIRDILEEHQIPYFITYGTLLGAVRHKGFIPWDDDFDFYLFDDTYKEAMEVLSTNLPQDMFLENWDTEPLYFHDWAHVKDMNSCTECELFPQDGLYSHKGISIDLYKTKLIHEKEEEVYRLSKHESYLKRRHQVGLLDSAVFDSRIKEISSKLINARRIIEGMDSLGEEIYAFYLIYNDRLHVNEMFPLRRHRFEDTEFYGPNNADAMLSRCYGDYMKLPPLEKRHPHYSRVKFL